MSTYSGTWTEGHEDLDPANAPPSVFHLGLRVANQDARYMFSSSFLFFFSFPFNLFLQLPPPPRQFC